MGNFFSDAKRKARSHPFFEEPYRVLSDHFQPIADFSPVKTLAYALSLILLFGISIFVISTLLVSLLFLALLLMSVFEFEESPEEQEIVIH